MRMLVCLLFFFPFYCFGKVSYKRPFRIHFYGAYSLPLGSFNHKRNDLFVIGQGTNGGGGGFRFSRPMVKQFHCGLGYNPMGYGLNSRKIDLQVYDMFDEPNYYTDVKTNIKNVEIHRLFTEYSYIFRTKHIELEPLLQFGIIFTSNTTGNDIIVHRKMRNSNYTEDIYIKQAEPANAAWGGSAGFRVNKRIATHLNIYLSTKVDFTGKVKYSFVAEKVDFQGKTDKRPLIDVSNQFTAFTVETGIQLCIFRSLKSNQ